MPLAPDSFGPLPPAHNHGPKCRLAPVSQPFGADEVNGIPIVKAQFFYTSPLPIDDPLSTSTIAGTTDGKSSKGSLQPFSRGDNNALENAWLSFASEFCRRNHSEAQRSRSPSPSLAKINSEKLAEIVQDVAVKHIEKHLREGVLPEIIQDDLSHGPVPESESPSCCPELVTDIATELRASFCAVARRRQRMLSQDRIIRAVMTEMTRLTVDSTTTAATVHPQSPSQSATRIRAGSLVPLGSPSSQGKKGTRDSGSSRPTSASGGRNTYDSQESRGRSHSVATELGQMHDEDSGVPIPVRPHVVGDGISGKPFVRVGTPDTLQFSSPGSFPKFEHMESDSKYVDENKARDLQSRAERTGRESLKLPSTNRKRRSRRQSLDVPVGISRLHEVSLPALQMKPIYWSPVNDVATVLRATWFYRDTMLPVDTSVANQLETGYHELRPHSETWNDELKCAVEVGPPGEEKVSHRLWPEDMRPTSKGNKLAAEPHISNNPFCAACCYRGEAAAEGSLAPLPRDDDVPELPSTSRKYAQYHVIYKDETAAFLLKPSLKPSAYYGRRPVAKIMNGMTIGVPVVRGFDRAAWNKLHGNKKASQEDAQQPRSAASDSLESSGRAVCPACKADKERGQVTDLVLVAHGIGQKFAERVESYHFTHAINAFRRAINIELGSDIVKKVLRDGQNGIMVLPVNWRHTLSFEDGGPLKQEDKDDYTPDGFGLKDIEPRTIPAVRSMISDVMFDIPFYMSHHKPKMIAALVAEANRVFRLWCRNNPGFAGNGRVHLIGHSLGSAMAVDILSRQPTSIPTLDLKTQMQTAHFEFDIKNLFLLGSPAAFFLLLERGALLPRRGRLKPGADQGDTMARDIVGEAGQYGCIAVDNIYNILAKEDPIAYLLTGTIDPTYSASLKTAYVPSATPSLLQSMGNAMKNMVPGTGASNAADVPGLVKPPTFRLPSQLELEVHDFSREEIAEKMAFLLNDNGQIDYYLRSGGGPLELQYLNMLSAHTSYWANPDLIRLLCMEIGRTPGKENTLPAMRAAKTAKRVIPTSM